MTPTDTRADWITARVDRYFVAHESGYATDAQHAKWTAAAEAEWARRHPAVVARMAETQCPYCHAPVTEVGDRLVCARFQIHHFPLPVEEPAA